MKTLNDFYMDVYACILTNKNPSWFERNAGLCYNLFSWCRYNELETDIFDSLNSQMIDSFFTEFGTVSYPFNYNDFHYDDEKDKYTNVARIAWIAKHTVTCSISELEKREV